MNDWSQQFDIVYKKFCDIARAKGADESKISYSSFRRFMGASDGKGEAWRKGQWPSAKDLEKMAKKLGLSYRWLVTGEGDPESEDAPPQQEQPATTPTKFAATPALPLMGFAGCSGDGLDMVMPFAMAVSPVILGPRAIAVVASGDSMIPAGIANGHTCFCDPDQEALPGEAVFIRQTDGKGALKMYLGPSEDKEGFTAFQGWMPKDDHGRQRIVTLEIADSFIDFIAPVVLVRRRA